MDPSILKLLEEDEDELMHSGVDVDAFTAALNRDIGGAGASCSQPSHSYFSVLSQENNRTSNQMYPHWQPSNQDENKSNRYRQRELFSQEREEQQSSEIEVKEHASGVEVQREVNGSQAPSGPPVEYKPMQIVNNQPWRVPEQVGHSANHAKQIPFASLLPIILPELDRDRASQLNTLFTKLRNEIDKNGFARNAKSLVGADRLSWAVDKMHAKDNKNQETGPSQFQAQSRNPMQKHLRPPSGTATQFPDAYPSGKLHQKTQNTPTMTVIQSQKISGHQNVGNNGFKSREVERLTDSHGKQANQMPDLSTISLQGLTKQHLHFPQGSSPMYGASSYNAYPGTNVGKSSTIVRPQSYDLQMRQVQCHQEVGSTHTRGTSQVMNVHKVEQQNSFNDPGVPCATMPNMSAACSTSYNSGTWQPMTTSASPMNGTGDDPKVSAKKLSTVQKNPLDAHGSSAPLPSKKQKVSGALVDQSIEHLNDVTAVSGVNLREEEEQLLSGFKDDSRVSEASRKAVQEEEDRLILQKMPLRKKLAEIMTKCGLKDLSNDVERCLSLCVEERLRGLISTLIRVSKQRVDSEKTRHNTVVTSDIRGQILAINRKAREEWQKKQAGVEKLRKYNDSNSNTIIDADKEKDEERGKLVKSNKVEDDKMRATAANVAARAAVGGDDILSKWQLMAQARQKDGKKFDLACASERGKDANNKQLTTSTGNAKDIRAACRKDQPNATSVSGVRRQSVGSQVTTPRRVSRNISLKDVLVVLEREPQMAKSTVAYRLHEEMHANA